MIHITSEYTIQTFVYPTIETTFLSISSYQFQSLQRSKTHTFGLLTSAEHIFFVPAALVLRAILAPRTRPNHLPPPPPPPPAQHLYNDPPDKVQAAIFRGTGA